MIIDDEIDQQAYSYLLPRRSHLARFYILPKIHKNKQNPPGHLIVSANSHPTENISQFVDSHLNPPGADAAQKMIGSKSIMVIGGLEIFQDNTYFYPRISVAIPLPILVDIGSWEEIYRKISYFQNLLCKFVKIASIYATKSFQFLKQFS